MLKIFSGSIARVRAKKSMQIATVASFSDCERVALSVVSDPKRYSKIPLLADNERCSAPVTGLEAKDVASFDKACAFLNCVVNQFANHAASAIMRKTLRQMCYYLKR